jgi:4-amino-4-deoxy-L-arabinose transferase-like glycosyltransferase
MAFVVRLLAAFVVNDFHRPELFEYEDLARSLLDGRGFAYHHLGVTYQSFTAPLYSWVCAVIYDAGGSVSGVLLLQMLIGSGHAVMTGWLAERLFSSRLAGVSAGLLMAAHPGLVVYASTKLHPLTIDALFFTLVLWQCVRLNDRPSIGRAVTAGVVAGLGALTRSTVIVFLPIGALWSVWVHGRERWRLVATGWLVAGLCAAAVILPWSVRNTLIHGELVWMLTTDAEAFWRGNNPHATGHSYLEGGTLVLETLTLDERRELRALPDELAQAEWFRARSWAFIKSDPARFVTLTLTKFARFWWFGPQTGILYPRSWLLAYQAYYVLVLALALLGIWHILSKGDSLARSRLALIILFVLVLSVAQSLYYVETRHRWAIEPFLLMLAGGATAWLGLCWRARRAGGPWV